jgi:DNA adenine methylase
LEHPVALAALAHFNALFPLEESTVCNKEGREVLPPFGEQMLGNGSSYQEVVVESASRLPHAIPYQGSKRSLAPLIARYIPQNIDTWFEPFAGSAAMTIYAAHHNLAQRFVIADSLRPMADLWRAIVDQPEQVARGYEALWRGQTPSDPTYFNRIRESYNDTHEPVELLYLICRCVKNAVRFNSAGRFTQSVDKRRLGMRPEKMSASLFAISKLLRGRTEIRDGDWLVTTEDAVASDFIYMDPPYVGTSIGRDKRYHAQLTQDEVVSGLECLLERELAFALSYDGRTGLKIYSDPLPTRLGLTHLQLHAGTSSQSTLVGSPAETIESLYLTPGLSEPFNGVIRKYRPEQERLFA